MENWFIHWFLRFIRWAPSHGFGVQSPFAYWFIESIIREDHPYYSYFSLEKKHPENKIQLALHRFFLRLSNMIQADTWMICGALPVVKDYIHAGCHHSHLLVDCERLGSNQLIDAAFIDLANMNYDNIYNVYEDFINHSTQDSVLVINNIRKDKTAKSFWSKVVSDSRTGVSFDLFYCGVVFFDLKKTKCNYKVALK